MPIQVITPEARERRKSFSEQIGQGVGNAIGSFAEYKQMQQQQQAENDALKKATGMDFSGISDPKIRQNLSELAYKGQGASQEAADKLRGNRQLIAGIEKQRGYEPGTLSEFENDPNLAEKATKQAKEPKQPLTEKPVPPDISKKMKKIVADNPKANADDLRLMMDEQGIPPVYSNPYTENRRRTEEQQTKSIEEKERTLRNETLPIRTELANKANAARQGIQNKLRAKEIIKRGDLNDPTYAAAAEILPFNLGKRLLSNDTVEYKAGLVDDFKDLSTIFKGATRVKEVEIYEDKIADIYLTDGQKEAILDARINALKADVIRGEVAAELEKEGKFYGALNFEEEVNKRAQPKLDALFNQIWDETKNTINAAENRKTVPLDPKDPDDLKIMQQIKKEAGGDSAKALKLANKKGYKFS